MRICGLNKTTLLDYPGHVAATVFLGGCNFRCPFCQNKDLVLWPDSQPRIEEEEVYAFLKKRRGILSGVCITGGEPTLAEGLEPFIKEIKKLDYLVKLDTNGYRPEVLRKLLREGLLDAVAMDVKNSMERYGETVGWEGVHTEKIRESISLVKNSKVDYEFRTTVVKELHEEKDMIRIGQEIEGAKAYFLQGYQESGGVILPGFHAYDRKGMERLAEAVRDFVPQVRIRGME